MNIRKMTAAALLAAVICVLAPMAVPIGPIPVTLATFAIYIASASVDWKHGLLAVAVYILVGAVGLPVFSGFTGGVQKLFGATGGYIAGYIPCALIAGLLIDRFENKKWIYPAAMVLGTAVLYALGTAWFMFVTKNSLAASLAVCVVPFLPGDALKIVAASAIAYPLRRLVRRATSYGKGAN